MAHPFGAPAIDGPDGSVISTTTTEVQQWLGSQYQNAGIIPSIHVKPVATTSSGWSYNVPATTLFAWTDVAKRLGVIISIPATNVPVSPASATASRVDAIWVTNEGVLKVGTPGQKLSTDVEIDRFTLPAGATSTASAVRSSDRIFAIPTGGSLGRLAYWRDAGGDVRNGSDTTPMFVMNKDIYLPTDRLVRIDMTTTVKGAAASDKGAFRLGVEGGFGSRWGIFRFDGAAYQSTTLSYLVEMQAGAHRLSLKYRGDWGGKYILADTASDRTEISVTDQGPKI